MLVTELSSRQAEGSGGFIFLLSPIIEQQLYVVPAVLQDTRECFHPEVDLAWPWWH